MDLIYWPTGNPGLDYAGEVHHGDNLFSNSLLALDPDTGAIEWYFQFTPHDTHDWDSNETPVPFDAEINGRPRQLVALANRNAFYYALDAATGELLWDFKLRGRVRANPMTYAVDGRQFVAIPGGNVLFAFALP